MSNSLDGLFTPGGRFVMGDLMVKQDKDFHGKPIPEDKQRYWFGVAVPKTQPGVTDLIGQLYNHALAGYAQAGMVVQQIQQGLSATGFAWKISDGDVPTMDEKTGQPKKIPEYLQGCYIFKFSTMWEFGACDENGVDINRADIKRGDYVDLSFNATVDGTSLTNPGLFLNPVAIRRLGFGDAISGQGAASTAFAGHGASTPTGATQMPTGNAATPPATTGMPGADPNAQAGGGMPGAGGQADSTASPGNQAQPHTEILNGPAGGGGMPGM